jgi:hypothetical protein
MAHSHAAPRLTLILLPYLASLPALTTPRLLARRRLGLVTTPRVLMLHPEPDPVQGRPGHAAVIDMQEARNRYRLF